MQNPHVKQIVKLRDDKRQRQHDGLMLVEGRDEINLALAAGHKPRTIVTSPELAIDRIQAADAEAITVIRAVFEKMSYRENPDGWLAVFPIPKTSLNELRLGKAPLLIIAESIEKPGNLGAMLRTADAADVDAVLVCDPRVDLYNPNVVRASRGALFAIPTIETSNEAAVSFLQAHGVRIIAAVPQAGAAYTTQDLRGPVAVAVGTEDAGLSDFWLRKADVQIQIPMRGKINSLNVSVATALIIYEAVRQRGL